MTSPYIYKINKKINLHDLICIPFWIDEGTDNEVMRTIEDWLSDPQLKVYFKDKNTFYTLSPDLDEIEITFGNNYIALSAFLGVNIVEKDKDGNIDGGDIVDADYGKFIIKGDTIVKFTYIGSNLD